MNYRVVSDLREIAINDWLSFVDNHCCCNIFQTYYLYDVYRDVANHEPWIFVVLDKDNNIYGCMTGVIMKNYGGLLGNFTSRSIVLGGPLVLDNDEIIVDLLLKEYDKFVSKKAIYTQFRNIFDLRWAETIFYKNGYKYEPHLDIKIDLTLSKEDIRKNISKNKRGNVSKTTNRGTIFNEIKNFIDYERCIDLVFKTYKRIGLPCPSKQFFVSFYSKLIRDGYLRVFAAIFDGKIIGTRMELCYKNLIYDWFAGSDDEYKNYYPNDFLPYNILMWGVDNGFEIFDFGGAGKPNVPYSVREHKIKFGGDLVEFGRYEKVHKPIKMRLGRLAFGFYKKIKGR